MNKKMILTVGLFKILLQLFKRCFEIILEFFCRFHEHKSRKEEPIIIPFKEATVDISAI
jgi:hypothetical protein